MDYISQSTIHCSKVNLKYVLNFTKFSKKSNGYMFKTNCSSIEHQQNKLGACFNKERGRISSHAKFLTKNSYPHKSN